MTEFDFHNLLPCSSRGASRTDNPVGCVLGFRAGGGIGQKILAHPAIKAASLTVLAKVIS